MPAQTGVAGVVLDLRAQPVALAQSHAAQIVPCDDRGQHREAIGLKSIGDKGRNKCVRQACAVIEFASLIGYGDCQ